MTGSSSALMTGSNSILWKMTMVESSTLQPDNMLTVHDVQPLLCRQNHQHHIQVRIKLRFETFCVNMDFGSGIPGDGRCLFRSVVHGACLRSGKPSPSESHEKELADDLRAAVADEFIKRRADSEWFVEGDFDTYVARMRQPHVWGGEPELLMSSYVLQLPITVHMWDKKKNCLKVIAEYGQEYGKENPIRVLYHGYGHYDALQSPSDVLQAKLSKRW